MPQKSKQHNVDPTVANDPSGFSINEEDGVQIAARLILQDDFPLGIDACPSNGEEQECGEQDCGVFHMEREFIFHLLLRAATSENQCVSRRDD